MSKSKLALGDIAKDRVTGFKGTVIGFSEWLTGCDQVCLKPPVDKNGDTRKGEWFDEGEITYVSPGLNKKAVASRKNGGPQKDAPRA